MSKQQQRQRQQQEEQKPQFPMQGMSMYRWFLIALVIIFGLQFFWNWSQQGSSLPYTSFKDMVRNGKITKVEIDQGMLTAFEKSAGDKKDASSGKSYNVVIPTSVQDDNLMSLLEENDVTVVAIKDTSELWNTIIWFILPIALMLGFFFFMSARLRGSGGGPGGLLSMGKMNAQAYTKEKVKTTFDDVAGSKEQKEALYEIIHFLRRPQDFHRLGGRAPKGVLLVGPPGTGKTLLARAVAGEAGVPFFHVSGSAFLEMLVGVGASRVRDLFATAKKNTPCIIFVDEIDSIGRRRGGIQGFYGGGASEMEQTLNQLLSEMDGFEPNEDVIVMAATNQPDVLDPALLRPGRFDRRITVDLPNLQEREAILNVHTRKVPLGEDVNLKDVARSTPGNSGADLKNLVNEAAILASKKRKDQVEREDFMNALDTIMLGHVRSSVILSEEEKRRTAYHEGGHALIAKLTPGSDPVTKVSIVPRGRALGVTMQTPLDERHNYTEDYLLSRLAVLLGGRAAELLVFDSISTGAENDLTHCTTLARNMVARYGMSEKLGNMSLMDPGGESYINENPFAQRNFSDDTLELVDSETRRLIDDAYDKAKTMLREHRDTLDLIAKALLQHEGLDGHELDVIINEKRIPETLQANGNSNEAAIQNQ
ncbi:MAG: ATP-dependent zinc metalloprotease FtsH [Bacteroidetes bacterium]|nr:ATP-dependent zinc metalloprotease FtsH [Bacteroidota bacterium]